MSNVRQLLDNGVPIYPITDKTLVLGLNDVPFEFYVVAWDGASTPVAANIPAGVSVTYNGNTYTGSLAASSATAPYLYLVASTSQQGEYDRYITTHTGSTYAWTALGSTAPVSPVIADNLTTNDASKALSAKQGKILGEEVSELEAKVTEKADKIQVPTCDSEETLLEAIPGSTVTGNKCITFDNQEVAISWGEYASFNVAGYGYVRFLGVLRKASSPNNNVGWCFLDSNNARIDGGRYEENTDPNSYALHEYLVEVPAGATTFKVNLQAYFSWGSPFYCYGKAGNFAINKKETEERIKSYSNLVGSIVPLQQGGITTAGVVWYNANRVTTGVFEIHNQNLVISTNNKVEVQYLLGNSKTLLIDKGYIDHDGATVEIQSSGYKYAAFVFVCKDSITPSDDLGIVIAVKQSANNALLNRVNEASSEIDLLSTCYDGKVAYSPIVSGKRDATGALLNDGTYCCTNIFRVNGTYKIGINNQYQFTLRYKAVGASSYSEIALRKKTFTTNQIDGYLYILIEATDYSAITPALDFGLSVVDASVYDSAPTQNSEKLIKSGAVFAEYADLKKTVNETTVFILHGGTSEIPFAPDIILRKGVSYEVTFESTSFTKNAGAALAMAMYRIPACGEGERVNDGFWSSFPNTVSFTPAFDQVLRINTNITTDSYVKVSVKSAGNVDFLLNNNLVKLTESYPFRKKLVTDMFVNGSTVSDLRWKTVMSDGFDIKDGMCCVGMAGNAGYGEGSGNPWSADLAIFSLGDIEGTKRVVRICDSTDSFEYNGEWITTNAPQTVIAKWTGENEITVLFRAGGHILTRKYDTSTNTLGGFNVCEIEVSGVSYVMESEQSIIEAIWTASGINHPRGRTDADEWTFYLNGNPIKIGNDWYLSISIGNYSHALCKSADLQNWAFVKDIVFGDDSTTGEEVATEEVALCYYIGRLYATSRGNMLFRTPSNIYQWSRITYCEFADIENSAWEDSVILENMFQERPTMAEVNGMLYVIQGLYQNSLPIDGVDKGRARKALLIFDGDLNILRENFLEFEIPILHPIFANYAGTLISVTSSDLRGFGVLHNGDGRSEIVVSRLNAGLLYMACEPHYTI